jgi:hypothetical protein
MVSVKYAVAGGLYFGVGLSGKYLVAATELGGYKFTKEFDAWGNIIVGYFFPIQEFVFLSVEGRFGYNFTNKQYSKTSPSTGTHDIDSTYDACIYVGVGYRTAATGI